MHPMKNAFLLLFFLKLFFFSLKGQSTDTSIAHQLWLEGQELFQLKAYHKAQEKWLAALDVYSDNGNTERVIDMYYLAGDCSKRLEDWEEALDYFEKALEKYQKNGRVSIPKEQKILEKLVNVTQQTFSLQASNYVIRLSDLALIQQDTSRAIQHLLQIATDLFNQNNLTAALFPLKKAETILTDADPSYFEILFNIGYLYNVVGKQDSAILYHDRCFEFLDRQEPTPHFLLANLYNHLGQNSAFDNHSNEIKLFLTALHHAKKANNLDLMTMIYTNMLKPFGVRYRAYGNASDRDALINYLDTIKQLYPQIEQPRFNYLVAANGIITGVYLFRNDTQRAEHLIKDTESLVKDPEQHNITYFMQRGHLELLKGNPDAALEWIQRAIEKKYTPFVPQKSDIDPFPNPAFEQIKFETVWNLFPLKARAYYQIYQKSLDLQDLKKGLHSILLVDSLFNYHFNTNLFTPSLEFDFSYAIPLLQELFEQTNDAKYFDQAMYFAEKNKAIYFIKHLNQSVQLKNTNVDPKLLDQIAKAQEQIKVLEAQLNNQKSTITQNELQRQKANLIKLVTSVQLENPSFFNFTFGLEDYLNSVQNQYFHQDEVVIEWVEGLNDFYGLVQSKEIKRIYRATKTTHLKDQVYQKFRKSVQSKSDEFYSISEELYHHFIRPVASIIEGKKLVVVPEGILSHIPFELLMKDAKDPSTYLLKNHEIRYSYSLAWENFNQTLWNSDKPNDFLVFAHSPEMIPDEQPFSEVLRDHLTPIPGAIKESEHLSKLFDAALFINEKANEETFKSLASNYNNLHLATHAFINETSAHQPCLIFSNTTNTDEDNLLYIHEILNLNLSADLVTLSACQTGVGDYHPGNGSNSLGMAFAYAGSNSLVSSLWSVPDESTSRIMELFYGFLKKGIPKAQALRKAKLAYANEANDLLKHPYYWGAFTYYGKDTPLLGNNGIYYQLVVPTLLLLIIGGILFFYYRHRNKSA